MQMRKYFGLFAMLLGLAVSAGQARAQEKNGDHPKGEHPKKAEPGDKGGQPDPAMMAAYEKAGKVGPQHELLKSRIGSFNHVAKFRMSPDQPWMESKGATERKIIMGGRYVQQETKSAPMMEGGPAFEGLGITGYDNIQNKFVNFWIDNEGTGVMISYGTADGSNKVITYSGEYPDVMVGKLKKVKSVTRYKDDKTEVYEMYDTGADGKEYVNLEVTYTKK